MTLCYCGLPPSHCVCDLPQQPLGVAPITIWLHPQEYDRPTNTARLAAGMFDEVRLAPWHRGIQAPEPRDDSSCLLFPDDRAPWATQTLSVDRLNDETPVLLLDGHWKECRKMLRQTPWLQALPRLSLDNLNPSRYPLRRGATDTHLCTAEALAALLRLRGKENAAAQLEVQLQRFCHHYQAFKSGHPPRVR